MSFQGKQLSAEMIEMVVHLKKHYDEERKTGKLVPTKDPAGRAAKSLGLGVATVKRIMSHYTKSEEKVVVHYRKRPGRPPSRICPGVQPIVRQFIRNKNLGGQRVSIDRVVKFLMAEHEIEIPKMTLWRALKRWGFTHGEGRRRDSLKEQDRVILARRDYLRAKLSNRNPDGTLKRPEVYLDETYINKNHSCRFTWYLDEDGPLVNKPSGVGPRLILVHAITKDGWVKGGQLVFEAKKRTGDYHGQMNWDNFSRWFTFQLLPNIPPESIVICDNAPYHNVISDDSFPRKNSTKEQLRLWLTRNGYPWREDMLKAELFELCIRLSPVPEHRLDKIAEKHGVTILRTPPYHPELQPIETCWAVVKNDMADNCDFTIAGLRNRLPKAFAKVTPQTCRDIIAKVVEQEDRYWLEDERLDEVYAGNAEEEYAGQVFFEAQGEESYLEAI
ncbi:MAG: transposase [Planctomycetes bacterium]|nr:transposase [Planctomycetota bacterium]